MSYTIHVNLFPPRAADDPTFGAADSVYHSIDNEIIARHRIVNQSAAAVGVSVEVYEKDGPFGGIFRTNNTRLYELLTGIFAETDAHIVLKPYK